MLTTRRAMNWDSWPQNNQGKIVVPTNLDQTLQTAGKPAGKTFMMGVSPLQFKHMDGGNNWYVPRVLIEVKLTRICFLGIEEVSRTSSIALARYSSCSPILLKSRLGMMLVKAIIWETHGQNRLPVPTLEPTQMAMITLATRRSCPRSSKPTNQEPKRQMECTQPMELLLKELSGIIHYSLVESVSYYSMMYILNAN